MTNPAATTRSIATLRSAWGRAEVAHEKANLALYIAEKAGRKADGARTRERAAWERLCEAKAAYEAAAAAAAAPAVRCTVCGEAHEVTPRGARLRGRGDGGGALPPRGARPQRAALPALRPGGLKGTPMLTTKKPRPPITPEERAARKAAAAERKREAEVRAAAAEARLVEIRRVVASGVCPLCGAGLRRNTSITGWWSCEQNGAPDFRARPADPPCAWQGFTE